MLTRLCTLALTALFVVVATPAAAGSVEAVKDRFIDTWQGVTAFKCDIAIETREAEADVAMDSSGSMQALRQNTGSFHWRMDLKMTISTPDAPEPFDAQVLTAYDGEFVYTIMDFMGQKQVQRTRDPGRATVPIGEEMWNDLEADATLTYLGEGEVNGVPVHRIQVAWDEEGEDLPAGTAVYAFRQDNALVVRAEIDTGNDSGVVIMTASGYDLDASIEESVFEIEIPVGARIIDLD